MPVLGFDSCISLFSFSIISIISIFVSLILVRIASSVVWACMECNRIHYLSIVSV